MKHSFPRSVALLLAATVAVAAMAQNPPRVTPMTPDVVDKYEQTLASADFIRREAMVPMRDGTKLYTVDRDEEGHEQRAHPAVAHAVRRASLDASRSRASASSTSSK